MSSLFGLYDLECLAFEDVNITSNMSLGVESLQSFILSTLHVNSDTLHRVNVGLYGITTPSKVHIVTCPLAAGDYCVLLYEAVQHMGIFNLKKKKGKGTKRGRDYINLKSMNKNKKQQLRSKFLKPTDGEDKEEDS